MGEQMTTGMAEEQIAREQNLTTARLVTAIARQKGRIVLTGLIFAVLAFGVSRSIKPYFTASTEVIPPQLKTTSAASLLGQLAGGDTGGGLASIGSALQAKSQTDTFTVLLMAWPVQDEMVKRFDLRKVYHARSASAARAMLGGATKLLPDRGFIYIQVTDTDPKRAAMLANGYVDAVRTFMKGLALSDASQRRVFYEEQLAQVKEGLSQAESNFKQMQQSSRMLSLDSQARTALQSAAELRSNITAREVELQRLRSYLTESNSQVQIAESELSALRGKLAQAEASGQGGFSGGGGLSNVPASELNFIRANRELKYQEALYDLMVKQYEGSRIDEARDAPAVQVIEPALVPEGKAGPHRSMWASGGFALGLALGLVWTVFRFWRSLLTPEGSTQWLELRRALFHF